jgi:hypothetical protein
LKTKALYISLFLFLCLFLYVSTSYATEKKFTHIVKKGDTLWSICEHYYGDPFLWPELWEMNKFITNPHWLKPGEAIELFQYKKMAKKEHKPIEKKKKPLATLTGIDASGLTNLKAIGFLSSKKAEVPGKIFDFKHEKNLASHGNIVYVKMDKEGFGPGDRFTVLHISDPVKHPLTQKDFGYIHSFKGILEIVKTHKDYYTGKILESFRPIQRGDCLIPYQPMSSCIIPVPFDGKIDACIMAVKDELQLIGQHSIVYLNAGYQEGVRKGYVFDALQEKSSFPGDKKETAVSLPSVTLGRILILETREHTSTGIVFSANREFYRGVKVQPYTWKDKPFNFGTFPVCTIE